MPDSPNWRSDGPEIQFQTAQTIIVVIASSLPIHPMTVMPAKAGIQYAAASRFDYIRLWNTGSPAFAGDDRLECR
jgi:hypothetical protein